MTAPETVVAMVAIGAVFFILGAVVGEMYGTSRVCGNSAPTCAPLGITFVDASVRVIGLTEATKSIVYIEVPNGKRISDLVMNL
jgi:hypothetical protein